MRSRAVSCSLTQKLGHFKNKRNFLFIYKMLRSAVHQPTRPGTNGPSNYLLAGQDFISLCVYYDLYGLTEQAKKKSSPEAERLAGLELPALLGALVDGVDPDRDPVGVVLEPVPDPVETFWTEKRENWISSLSLKQETTRHWYFRHKSNLT